MASKAKKELKKETGLSVSTKKKEDLGMWYQEVLTVSYPTCRPCKRVVVWTDILAMLTESRNDRVLS